MKRSWQVQRTHHAHAESERRWARVYQLLLQWAATPNPSRPPTQEDHHADRDLRPGLDSTPSPDPNH